MSAAGCGLLRGNGAVMCERQRNVPGVDVYMVGFVTDRSVSSSHVLRRMRFAGGAVLFLVSPVPSCFVGHPQARLSVPRHHRVDGRRDSANRKASSYVHARCSFGSFPSASSAQCSGESSPSTTRFASGAQGTPVSCDPCPLSHRWLHRGGGAPDRRLRSVREADPEDGGYGVSHDSRRSRVASSSRFSCPAHCDGGAAFQETSPSKGGSCTTHGRVAEQHAMPAPCYSQGTALRRQIACPSERASWELGRWTCAPECHDWRMPHYSRRSSKAALLSV